MIPRGNLEKMTRMVLVFAALSLFFFLLFTAFPG